MTSQQLAGQQMQGGQSLANLLSGTATQQAQAGMQAAGIQAQLTGGMMGAYRTLSEYRRATLGTEDGWHYRNAKTGRPVHRPDRHHHVILVGENDRLGYRSAAELERTAHGWELVRDTFDQQGECRTVAELLDVLSYMDDQR